MNKVSVLLLTKNEEKNIADCLESVSWSDDLYVFDSYSSDQTLEIAKEYGAKIVQRAFDNFSDHKNWAIDNIPFQYEWLLIVDADERVTTELHKEIYAAVQVDEISGYYLARKNMFMGKWIRHGGWYPDYQLRLFRLGKAKYEKRIVHEHILLMGQAGYLKSPLVHHDFKGLDRYFDRHNTYSGMEAVEVYRLLRSGKSSEDIKTKRRILKEIAYKYLPCRPLVKFFWMYFFKLGFLDGQMGLRFCLLHAFYEFQISLKLEELKDTNSPLYQKYKKLLTS